MHETLQRIIDENTEAEVEAYIMPLVKLLGGRLTRLIGSYKVLEKLVSGNYYDSVIAIPMHREKSCWILKKKSPISRMK